MIFRCATRVSTTLTAAVGSGHRPPPPQAAFRDRLRRTIRRAADGVPDGGQPALFRALGSLLARHPGLRQRARLGLPDGVEAPAGRTGRCLEVGPGQGIDLFCLRTLGWDAHGLEPDALAAEQARRTSGCEVRVGTLATTDYPASSFDLVYMRHVFEHLPDPVAALARCHELLAPGGRLVLVYPNPGALTARRYGPLSPVWEPPRHLVLPPAPAARTLVARAGFEAPQARTLAWEAAASAEAARRRRRGQSWSPLELLRPGPLARLLALVEFLLVTLGAPLGEEILVRARKPQVTG